MKKHFVNYEIAFKLKELGFNEECFGYYTKDKFLCIFQEEDYFLLDEAPNIHIVAPIYQQVIVWFEKMFEMSINLYKVGDSYVYTISVPYHSEIEGFSLEYFYEDLYVRTTDAILKAIELCKK